MAFRRKKSSQPESVDPNTPPPGAEIADSKTAAGDTGPPAPEDLGSVAVAVLPDVPLPAWAGRMPLTGQLLAAQEHIGAGEPISGGLPATPVTGDFRLQQSPSGTNLLPPPDPIQRSEEAAGPVFYEEGPGSSAPESASTEPGPGPQWTTETPAATGLWQPQVEEVAPQWNTEAPQATPQWTTEADAGPQQATPQWTTEADAGPQQATPQWTTEAAQTPTPTFGESAAAPAIHGQPPAPNPSQRTDTPQGPVVHAARHESPVEPPAQNWESEQGPPPTEPTQPSTEYGSLEQPPVGTQSTQNSNVGPPPLEAFPEPVSTQDQETAAPQWGAALSAQEPEPIPPIGEAQGTGQPSHDLAEGRPEPIPQTTDPALAWFTDVPGAPNQSDERESTQTSNPTQPPVPPYEPDLDEENPIEWSSDFEADFPPADGDDRPIGGSPTSGYPQTPTYPPYGTTPGSPAAPSGQGESGAGGGSPDQGFIPQDPDHQWPPASPSKDGGDGPTSQHTDRADFDPTTKSFVNASGETVIDLRDPWHTNAIMSDRVALATGASNVAAAITNGSGSQEVNDSAGNTLGSVSPGVFSTTLTLEPDTITRSDVMPLNSGQPAKGNDSELVVTTSVSAGQPPLGLPLTRPMASEPPTRPAAILSAPSQKRRSKRWVVIGTVLVGGCLAAAAIWIDNGSVSSDEKPPVVANVDTPAAIAGLTRAEATETTRGLLPGQDSGVAPVSAATYVGDEVQATVWIAPSGIDSTAPLFAAYRAYGGASTQAAQGFSPGIRGGVLDCAAIDATRTVCFWGNQGVQGGAEITGLNRTRAADLVSQMRADLEPR